MLRLGTNHDAYLFKQSALCAAMDNGVFVPGNPSITIHSVRIAPLIVVDTAYPIHEWLMKPYGGHGEQWCLCLKCCLSQGSNVVKCAFGRLKAWWQCLTVKLSIAENVIAVISVCVILYNICKDKGHVAEGIYRWANLYRSPNWLRMLRVSTDDQKK